MKWTQIHSDGYSGTLASEAGDGVIVRVELYDEAAVTVSITFVPDSKLLEVDGDINIVNLVQYKRHHW